MAAPNRPNNFPPNIQAALQKAADESPSMRLQERSRIPGAGGAELPNSPYTSDSYRRPDWQFSSLPAPRMFFSPQTSDFPPISPPGNGRLASNWPGAGPPLQAPGPSLGQSLYGTHHSPQTRPSLSLSLQDPTATRQNPSQLLPVSQALRSAPIVNLPHSPASTCSGNSARMDGFFVPHGTGQAGIPQSPGSHGKSHLHPAGQREAIGRPGPRAPYRGFRGSNRGARGTHYTQHRLFNPYLSPSSSGAAGFASQLNLPIQTNYLNDIVNRELLDSITPKEMKRNENFRKKLERILQDMVREWAKDNVTVNPAHVKLRCYGSMANGFAVPGSDMDLLLMFPKDEGPVGAIENECRRMFEKRLLNEGIGARLLTKTRVPILRVCQSPSEALLEALRAYRVKSIDQEREEEIEKKMKKLGLKGGRLPDDTAAKSTRSTSTIIELDNHADIPLPPSPVQENVSIEFDDDVGLQCDINFTNYVAIHNTSLLRCYCICDDRVQQLGLVVKAWVKARKINTPYHGTLSSYGYILMVLHYLLNVAVPPVIPNLQVWARAEDSWKEGTKNIPLFDGFDVRFFDDEAALRRMSANGELTKNRETLGSLLRGFFYYYADPRGFHFGQEVISIRTPGGIVRKAAKGWTEAKWAGNDSNVRLRYLLCIEDPFETEHNVARTVGHSGIVAIRDEFRRAWDILNRIEFTPGHGWEWRRPDGSFGEDLFAPPPNRGDLLKKDMEYNREKGRAAANLREEQATAQKQLEAAQKKGEPLFATPRDVQSGAQQQGSGKDSGIPIQSDPPRNIAGQPSEAIITTAASSEAEDSSNALSKATNGDEG